MGRLEIVNGFTIVTKTGAELVESSAHGEAA